MTAFSHRTVRLDATFSPSAYREAIALLFKTLDTRQRRDLIDKYSLLPRHIHRLANDGLIAAPVDRGR